MLRRLLIITAALTSLVWANLSFANPQVTISTNYGDIDIELFEKLAPRTVSNFLELVDEGFYDGLIFHRVIANFMIQAGGYTPDMKYKPAAWIMKLAITR
ncbi:MAG: peptidylprolyl isomerase [Pseudomonadales bacterium]